MNWLAISVCLLVVFGVCLLAFSVGYKIGWATMYNEVWGMVGQNCDNICARFDLKEAGRGFSPAAIEHYYNLTKEGKDTGVGINVR